MRSLQAGLLMLLLFVSWPALAIDTFKISGIEGSADAIAGAEVVREGYRRLGYDVEITWMPGAKALQSANSGATDAELQRIDGITETYSNLIQVPVPINLLYGVAFSRDVSIDISSWYSLSPYRIGVVHGILFAKRGTQGMQVTEARDYAQLIDMLEDGTVDVAVMPRINGLLAIKRHQARNIREVEGVLESQLLYHYVNKRHADLVPLLRKMFKKMLLDGTTRRIYNRVNAAIEERVNSRAAN